MKNFVDFIIDGLVFIFKFLFISLFIFITFAYIFSLKNNMSFENTVSYFQTIGNEIIGFKTSNETSLNVSLNEPLTIITTSNNNYYYEQLDDIGKTIYTSIENNIDNLKKENYVIDFATTFNDLLHETTGQYKLNRAFQSALDAFFYDHPELFYIDISKISLNIKSISIGPLKTYTVEIAPVNNKNYLYSSFNSEQEVDNAIAMVENRKNNIVNTVSNENVYNKILKVHDMLVNSIKYDTTLSKENTHNIYGALVQKQVVCEGYAKAFKYILDSLNIECILVCGNATNSSNQTESHMWNYVKLNDTWYGVDVTWDDPIIIGGSNGNNLRHDFFLKGQNSFLNSHYASGKISDTGKLFSIPTLANKNFKY